MRFDCRRVRTAAGVGFVAVRCFFTARVFAINARSCATARALLVDCERVSCEVITNSPVAVSRFSSRSFSSAVSSVVLRTFQRTATLVLTLLACWPPGPPLRIARKVSSGSSAASVIFFTRAYQLVRASSCAAFKMSRRLTWPTNLPWSTIGKRRTGEFKNALAASTTSAAGVSVCTLRLM